MAMYEAVEQVKETHRLSLSSGSTAGRWQDTTLLLQKHCQNVGHLMINVMFMPLASTALSRHIWAEWHFC